MMITRWKFRGDFWAREARRKFFTWEKTKIKALVSTASSLPSPVVSKASGFPSPVVHRCFSNNKRINLLLPTIETGHTSKLDTLGSWTHIVYPESRTSVFMDQVPEPLCATFYASGSQRTRCARVWQSKGLL